MNLLATCMVGVLKYFKLPSCTYMCDYESLLGEPCMYLLWNTWCVINESVSQGREANWYRRSVLVMSTVTPHILIDRWKQIFWSMYHSIKNKNIQFFLTTANLSDDQNVYTSMTTKIFILTMPVLAWIPLQLTKADVQALQTVQYKHGTIVNCAFSLHHTLENVTVLYTDCYLPY